MLKQIGGTTGAVFAGACCLGFAPLLAALGAVGLGFLIRDAVLLPLFLLFLGLTLWSLWASRASHHQPGPFYLGLGSAIAAFAALWFLVPLAYAGLLGLIAAAAWDIVTLRRGRVMPASRESDRPRERN